VLDSAVYLHSLKKILRFLYHKRPAKNNFARTSAA
jgi:hypothetical protein